MNVGSGTGDFEWDGFQGTNSTVVNAAGELNIDVDRIDAGTEEVFNGTLTINSGEVNVANTAGLWEMSGSLLMNNTGSPPVLDGDVVAIQGTVEVGGSGQSVVAADSIFGASSSVNVASGAQFYIRGSNATINGGSFTGTGTVDLDADVTTVAAATTVNMPNGAFDIDGNLIINDTVALDAPLTLNVGSIDSEGDSNIESGLRIGDAGQLNVQFTDPGKSYSIAHTLELNGPSDGFTALHLAGADVEIAAMTTVTGSSTLQARTEFSGDINVAADAELNLQGGSIGNPNQVRFSALFSGEGQLRVLSSGYLNIEDGATVGVDLENNGRLEPGFGIGTATLGGSLTQTAAGVLGFEIAGPPDIAQDFVQVAGTASLAGDLEVSLVGDFIPSTGDIYPILTTGQLLSEFDSLTINTASVLDVAAELSYSGSEVLLEITDVSMFGDFNDDLALTCADVDALVSEIANGGMDALFDLNGDAMVDQEDLGLWLAEAGNFNVGGPYIPGDANLDGSVDGLDFIVWNANKFTNTAAWCQADFNADGVSDGLDFIIWNTHKFTASDANVAVPEPSAGLSILLALVFWHRASPFGCGRD